MGRAFASKTVNSDSIPFRVKSKSIKIGVTVSLLDVRLWKGDCQASTASGRQVGKAGGQVAASLKNQKVTSLSPCQGCLVQKDLITLPSQLICSYVFRLSFRLDWWTSLRKHKLLEEKSSKMPFYVRMLVSTTVLKSSRSRKSSHFGIYFHKTSFFSRARNQRGKLGKMKTLWTKLVVYLCRILLHCLKVLYEL